MQRNPKHDAKKIDERKNDDARAPKSERKPRPRQDSLDRERATDEGMPPPEEP